MHINIDLRIVLAAFVIVMLAVMIATKQPEVVTAEAKPPPEKLETAVESAGKISAWRAGKRALGED